MIIGLLEDGVGNVLKIKSLLKDEISGWKIGEILWLLVASLVIFGLSIYWKDNLMGIVSAVTGVICVICTGKGKLSAYLFGLVNCVLYAIISYKARLYGETMLNIIYYVPMQFVGFYIWSKI
jgi:nicotinamide mononucleotide transporter